MEEWATIILPPTPPLPLDRLAVSRPDGRGGLPNAQIWNLDGGVDPAVALAGSGDADEEHRANRASGGERRRSPRSPGSDPSPPRSIGIRRPARPFRSPRRETQAATSPRDPDVADGRDTRRSDPTSSWDCFCRGLGDRGKGGRGGEEAKIEREETSAIGGGVDWPQTEEQVSGKAGAKLLFSILTLSNRRAFPAIESR
jgi:hypothetical protein